MKQRAITAVFFATAMIGGIYGGQLSFQILMLLIAAGCLWELMGLLLPEEEGKSMRRLISVCWGLAPILTMITLGEISMLGLALVPGFIFLLLVFELFGNSSTPFSNVGIYVLGFFYIVVPLILLLIIAHTYSGDYRPHRVFGLLWLVWTNDTFAYLIGSRIGRRKLFPRISPNKTWEGTIGGALCAVGMAYLLSQYFHDYSSPEWLAFGVLVGIFGTLGDLVESMLKRSVGVKDSGKLLPGHGGLLDRFDAFLFVLPFAWLVVMISEY